MSKMMIAALAAISFVVPASSAVITRQYALTASDFISLGTLPYSTFTGTFTLTFDKATTVSQATTGLTASNLKFAPTAPLAYTYVSGADLLIIGGTAASVAIDDLSSADFALVLSNASTMNAVVTAFSYSTGNGFIFNSLSQRVTTSAGTTTAVVPEPASWAMMVGGFGLVGAAMRRNRKLSVRFA